MRRSLLWQIYPTVLLIVLAALVIIYLNVSYNIRRFYESEKLHDLQVRAVLVRSQLSETMRNGDTAAIDAVCKRLGEETRTRVTVISITGKVLGESQKAPESMENHLLRPEVQQALAGDMGYNIRPSVTLKQPMMYVAVPLEEGGKVVSVVRTAEPISEFEASLKGVQKKIIWSGVILAVILAGVIWLVCWKLSRPLQEMRHGAQRFASGDLNHRLAIPNNREIASLAESMNRMASELDRRIETITTQRNEQQAILSSMTEGVLAVDVHNHCLSLNKAAAKMLQIVVPDPCGRTIPEIVRNHDLQEFIRRSMENPEPEQTHIVLHEAGGERHLQIHGTALRNGQEKRIGTLIVLNDITELHKLQMVRTDFVANVSHELKTPVTSIKGFIETLLDGAKERPEDLQRFLEIVRRQTERLNSIIDDLLTLSHVEQQAEKAQISFEEVPIRGLLLESAELCHSRAQQKQISLQIDCEEGLRATVNPSLLEQALVNLIDNAVSIRAFRKDGEICIEVEDHGTGISKEHLPRLFERFYRVDKARSRTLGGTGLGLAIVKHIIQVHHGRAEVKSTPGKGSCFTLHLPGLESRVPHS